MTGDELQRIGLVPDAQPDGLWSWEAALTAGVILFVAWIIGAWGRRKGGR